jgi:beta-glucosidase
MLGYRDGLFAPGASDWRTALIVAHHLLVSHGLSALEIRTVVDRARVGIALDCRPVRPASDSDEDRRAAKHFDGFRNRWFFDPVFGRGYPDDMMRIYRDRGRIRADMMTADDMRVIATPIDFLGLNYYTTVEVGVGGEEIDSPEAEPSPDPQPGYTEMGWRIDAGGLSRYLGELSNRYAPTSIIVSENGASYSDGPDESGVIDDRRRIDYLDAHVRAVAKARLDGAPVDGYFVWSLMDNVEWLEGFAQRFGLVWIDETTLERLPKRSFEWYRRLVTTGLLGTS